MNALGLDIGGANLKAAHSDGRAWSVPFALWKEPDQLAHHLRSIVRQAGHFDRIAATMTAELCDCFPTKRDGVEHVLRALEQAAQGCPVAVWTTAGRSVTPEQARAEPLACAAANWHALACFIAGLYPRGLTLLVDCGSTTTDVVRIRQGKVEARGLTDTQRLGTGELVYLGAVRTPLMALGPWVDFEGRTYGLAAEYFATMADVHLLTGDTPEDPDNRDTADGRAMTRPLAAARIARMIGADSQMLTLDQACALARALAGIAHGRVARSIMRILAGEKPDTVVLSGSGDFLASRGLALALEEKESAEKPACGGAVRIERLADRIGPAASSAACAYALAHLSGRA